jgi:hypothetical protein
LEKLLTMPITSSPSVLVKETWVFLFGVSHRPDERIGKGRRDGLGEWHCGEVELEADT